MPKLTSEELMVEVLHGKRQMWLPSVVAVLLADHGVMSKLMPKVQTGGLDPVAHVLRVVDAWTKGISGSDPTLVGRINAAHRAANVTPVELNRVWTAFVMLTVLFSRGINDYHLKQLYLPNAQRFGSQIGVTEDWRKLSLVELQRNFDRWTQQVGQLPEGAKEAFGVIVNDQRFKPSMVTDGWALRTLKTHLPARFVRLYQS